jgi:hypothetical protein
MTPKSPTFRGQDPVEIKNAGALSDSSERTEPSRGFEANLVSPHIRPDAGAARDPKTGRGARAPYRKEDFCRLAEE